VQIGQIVSDELGFTKFFIDCADSICKIVQSTSTRAATAGRSRKFRQRGTTQLRTMGCLVVHSSHKPWDNWGARACGKKGSWFIEKFTKERRGRPRDQQDARRICHSCYKGAVKAEQTASVLLPEKVDVSRCSRVTADVGKCSVCGIAKAVCIDREAGVKLCEHCYGREVWEDALEAGLV